MGSSFPRLGPGALTLPRARRGFFCALSAEAVTLGCRTAVCALSVLVLSLSKKAAALPLGSKWGKIDS